VKKIVAIFLIGSVAIPALAQERTFLPKGEVEILAAGKKWVHIRLADQNKASWALSNGGYLWGNNLTTGQADKGTWSVNEQGQLCVKWHGRSTDRCVAVLKDGEKLKMVDSNDLNGTYADLTVE